MLCFQKIFFEYIFRVLQDLVELKYKINKKINEKLCILLQNGFLHRHK